MRSVRNCKVAVIGGAGFLGSHLVDHLLCDRKCRVIVIDNLCAGRREYINPDASFVYHDITGSEEYLRNLFKREKVRYVLNYAAYPYVPDSYARPIRVADVNFMGAMKVINAAQESGCVKAVLQVSSAEVYGVHAGIDRELTSEETGLARSISECDPCIPHSSYGAAKAAIDAWVQVRWREAKTPCIALRQFNCIGERETHPYVLPEIISQITSWFLARHREEAFKSSKDMAGTPIVQLGNNSFRDFMYAGDAVRIAVELLERGEFGEVYNLGSETGIKVYDLAKLVGKVMGFSDVRVEQDLARVRPWEIWHLQSDNSKLYAALSETITGYNPSSGEVHTDKGVYQASGVTMMRSVNVSEHPLESAIKRTVRWYEENGRRWGWEY